MSDLRRLLGEFAPYRLTIIVAMVAATIASLLDGLSFALMVPFLRALFGDVALPVGGTTLERWLGWLLGDLLRTPTPAEAMRNVVALVLVATLVKNVFAFSAGYLSARVQERLVRDLRTRVFEHVQTQGLWFFQRARGGQLVTRVLSDAEHAKDAAEALMATLLQAATLIAVYLVILLSLSWRLTLLAMALAAVFPLIIRPVLRHLRVHARRQADVRGDLASIMSEAITGARLIKAHGAHAFEAARFRTVADRYSRQAIRARSAALAAQPLAEMFGGVITVVLLAVGTSLTLSDPATLPPAALIAFLVVALRLMSPLKRLSQLPGTVAGALASAGRLFELLDLTPEEVDPPTARSIEGFTRAIRYEGVWFSYGGDQWALQDVNLDVEPGEIVALVGTSGAGKTTFINLLPRFHDPTRGQILIDGFSITQLRRDSLRRLFGVVSQETVLFNASVAENIAYGVDNPSHEEIERAARAANAHEFITALPAGYATQLGERGDRLAGGERQRLAIARALFRNPPILILDEATSSLDTESERLVQEALARLMSGRTVFVIAHRLWTITHASQILVFDRGRIVERGRHEELLAGSGVYAKLHDLQFTSPGVESRT